jgi:hypothetical protein
MNSARKNVAVLAAAIAAFPAVHDAHRPALPVPGGARPQGLGSG